MDESFTVNPGTQAEARSRTINVGYDAAGRITQQRQEFQKASGQWQPFNSNRQYNLLGGVTSQTYPSGKTVNYTYVHGRTGSFSGTLGHPSNATVSYATNIGYNAAGQMAQETFNPYAGIQLYHTARYNNRFQMVETALGNSSDPATNNQWSRGRLRFYYSQAAINQAAINDDNTPSGSDNNGNLLRQEHYVPTAVTSSPSTPNSVISFVVPMRDDYTYDDLNRLKQVTGYQVNGNPASNPNQKIYEQVYQYDRFGNRTLDRLLTRGTLINRKVYNVLAQRNRFRELDYDAAGNVIDETGSGLNQRVYDAENRMIRAFTPAQQGYVYDGNGRRVRRYLSNGTEEWWQVYGIDGELLAEYRVVGGEPETTPEKEYGYHNGQVLVVSSKSEGKLWWQVTDQLGTARMQIDQTGALGAMKRHDYLPFGEELFVGMGGGSEIAPVVAPLRTTGMGYTAGYGGDAVRQRFAGKERDVETGLDYFMARYLSSAQGRFTSPDEFTGGPTELFAEVAAHNPTFYADLFDPQSLNKYAYCLGNPFRYLDPDGHQNTQSDRLAQGSLDYGVGVARGIVSSMTFGYLGGPRSDDSLASRAGQSTGTSLVGVVGVYSGYIGGGISLSGGGAIVGVPVAAGGAVFTGGALKNTLALGSTPMQMSANQQQGGNQSSQAGASEQSTTKAGFTGGDSKSSQQVKIRKDMVRVDVEYPTGGSTGNVHIQVKGPNKAKYYLNSAEDLKNLPKSIRKNDQIKSLVEHAFEQLEKAKS